MKKGMTVMSKAIILDAEVKQNGDVVTGVEYNVSNGLFSKDGEVMECWVEELDCSRTMSVSISGLDGNEVPIRLVEGCNGEMRACREDIHLVQNLYKKGSRYLHYYVIESNGELEYRTDRTRIIPDTTCIDWWANDFIEAYYGEGNGELTEECEAEYSNGCCASIEASFISEKDFNFLRKFIG